ncbi:uncharacterized protein LOC132741507 [Ruditapes philippinarum]|uniref:uncharacterized protein LOC132741507 n=1 Tax=Ruditapes philippinarum TaxID=129788 RepID=UPI00295C32D9|nr:uncharacterized protein LOC132741507 [Ruditapes philippinarum]
MKFLLSILVIIGNLNVLLANNDNCRENDLNALMVRLRALRTEFDKQKNVLEDLKEELKELRQNTSSEIAEIKESMKGMTVVVENIKKDLENSTSSLKAATDEVKASCNNRFSDLSQKFAALEKQIKELDQTTEKKTQTVAFNVMDAINYAGLEPIKFSNILLNEGDAYNKFTGFFTAPTEGIYLFTAHICGKKSTPEIEYHIKVRGSKIVTGEFNVPNNTNKATDPKCTSFSAAALVRKGDNVWVGGMFFNELDRLSGDDLSSFSGVLIQKV